MFGLVEFGEKEKRYWRISTVTGTRLDFGIGLQEKEEERLIENKNSGLDQKTKKKNKNSGAHKKLLMISQTPKVAWGMFEFPKNK